MDFKAICLSVKAFLSKVLEFFTRLPNEIKAFFKDLIPLLKLLKNKFVIIWCCVFLAVVIVTIALFNITIDYYQLSYNGDPIGYSRSAATIGSALSEVSGAFANDAAISADIAKFQITKIKSSNWFISCYDKTELMDVIVAASDTMYYGYSLYIDDVRVASLRNETMLNTVIENFKLDRVSVNKYIANENDECTVTIKEKLDIKHEYLAMSDIILENEYKSVYEIVSERVNYSIECLQTEEEKVPYVTYYTRNADLRAGEKKVITKGVNGTKDVQYKIIVDNGELVSKTVVGETVTKSAITAKIQIGSGVTGGLGNNLGLIFPVDGYITSPYGDRSDPFTGADANHNGIDIGARMGTSIYAASGGKVIQSSDKKNGFGKCVIIEHSSGFRTLYAHCSELIVNEGDYVSAGQLIAKVGSTGRSTGPHLHYSIIINGKYVDPTLYY